MPKSTVVNLGTFKVGAKRGFLLRRESRHLLPLPRFPLNCQRLHSPRNHPYSPVELNPRIRMATILLRLHLLCALVSSQNVVGLVHSGLRFAASSGYPLPPQNPIDS